MGVNEHKVPQILSVGIAFPKRVYTQDEVWDGLAYAKKYAHFKSIFTEAKINSRAFLVPLGEAMRHSWQDLQERYLPGAKELSKEAISKCLDDRYVPKDFHSITYVSCTGYSCPSVVHHMAADLSLNPGVYIANLLGAGCGGGFPGLRRAYDYTKGTHLLSLVVATELCSCCIYPEPDGIPDPENDYELLRADAIFADASVAVAVGYDNDWRHPYILDFESNLCPEYIRDLGFTLRDGRLRVLLSKRVKEIAPKVVYPAIANVLKRNQLEVEHIAHWVIHAAGSTVLDNIRNRLNLPEAKMRLSRKVLAEHGNCSSTTIGIIGKELMSGEVHPGEYVMVVSVGPGMEGGATLLRFGGV